MYGKLENNKLIYVPRDYNTGTNLIVNFDRNEKLMKQFGFKKIIDIKPEYNNNTHYLSIENYTEKEDSITINYKINEIDYQEQYPTLEEQIIDLNNVLDITLLATDEILTLIQPLLPEQLLQDLQSKTTDRLLNMYVAMIRRGLKKEDEINDKYKDKVIELLKQ